MITIKSAKEIQILREGGKRLAAILAAVVVEVKAGVSTDYLNDFADALIKKGSDKSSLIEIQRLAGNGRSAPFGL